MIIAVRSTHDSEQLREKLACQLYYLKKPDKEDNHSHGGHYAAVVIKQSLSAASSP